MESVLLRDEIQSLNDEWLFYLSPRFLTYRPRHKINFKTEKYTLKTAETMSELVELFRLRHHLFLSEGSGAEILDVDDFDSECDHIIIKCNQTNEICGTYRVITSNNHVGFYSETEFDLGNFLSSTSVKMELGRACIHHFHRNGHVIDLLWKGIGTYAKRINADVLFGCSSMPIQSPSKISALNMYLKKNQFLGNDFEVSVKEKYALKRSEIAYCELFSPEELKKTIPPLLNSYLNAGAKVYGMPALDEEFDCLDFLTILDLKSISSSYKKRYFKDVCEQTP